MSLEKTLGGDRLGSGKKMKVELHNYERANFDLSRIWRSTTTPGVLLPFFTEIGLNGDTFDIDLSAMARTVPTQGALFGSFKLQMDVFATPIRLYNGLLHNNALNIGMNMSQVKLPTIKLWQKVDQERVGQAPNFRYKFKGIKKWSNTCLSSMLNIRGISKKPQQANPIQGFYSELNFNALGHLAYYDIYKTYYANKQEENGQMIGGKFSPLETMNYIQIDVPFKQESGNIAYTKRVYKQFPITENWSALQNKLGWYDVYFLVRYKSAEQKQKFQKMGDNAYIETKLTNSNGEIIPRKAYVAKDHESETEQIIIQAMDDGIFDNYEQFVEFYDVFKTEGNYQISDSVVNINDFTPFENIIQQPQLSNIEYSIDIIPFPLENIDEMRRKILRTTDFNQAVEITNDAETTLQPYLQNCTEVPNTSECANQIEFNGICLKTYQSDLYNNWLSSEWVEQINNLSMVSTSTGGFSMDALNLAKKIYEMLNRIAVSGGTYEDWQEAVYGQEAIRRAESPIYCGGASAEIVFDEVISSSATQEEPLGTIAGRGNLQGFKNGQIVIKCEEPMFIMGIVSITPRIDYSQNRAWWCMNLKTMDDLHKPGLDGIGFQDLLTSQMCWEATEFRPGTNEPLAIAVGKQPAWINYQTAVNELHGEFCDRDKLGWMCLDRAYQENGSGQWDFTTYIDPRKYNYPFAYKELDAQNFWLQLGTSIQARRKMSAKVMPNV